ncbi:putative MATE family efflux protein [Aminobacter niigataensis]|uniref:MATE family efflux protein n=1 Tax=Aminobacter niigataensis TaxID=83265 RepID=A0ABR6L6N0_9HYPH|nr:putative MATE family efflux protein [Aminobacter niigataensis]
MDSASPEGRVTPFSVTNRSVLAIAVPMTLAYLTTPFIGLVGTGVVGQFGDAALLGGLAAGAVAFDVVFTSFNFLRAGTTALVAQAFGRNDASEEQAVFWRAVVIAIIAGIVLALTAPLTSLAGQWFMSAEPRVNETLDAYVRIRMLGAPFALVNYAILGYVLGRGEGSFALFLQASLNGVNIALSLLLGLTLGWGVEGVAWAAVAGEAAGMAIGFVVLLRRFARQPRLARGRIFDAGAFRHLFVLNRDIMIRSLSLLVAFALFTRQGAQFGTVTLAANAVLMNFFIAAGFFLDGFAAAAEQLAGRAVGARYEPAFRKAVYLCSIWGFALAGTMTTVLMVFGADLIALIATAEDVRAAAIAFLPWAAFTALSGVLAFQMDGIFIGAAWSRDMRNMMVLSLVVFVVALMTLAPAFGNHGLWAALHLLLIVRGVCLLAILGPRARATFQSGAAAH